MPSSPPGTCSQPTSRGGRRPRDRMEAIIADEEQVGFSDVTRRARSRRGYGLIAGRLADDRPQHARPLPPRQPTVLVRARKQKLEEHRRATCGSSATLRGYGTGSDCDRCARGGRRIRRLRLLLAGGARPRYPDVPVNDDRINPTRDWDTTACVASPPARGRRRERPFQAAAAVSVGSESSRCRDQSPQAASSSCTYPLATAHSAGTSCERAGR